MSRVTRAAKKILYVMGLTRTQKLQLSRAQNYYGMQVCSGLSDNAIIRNTDWEGTGLTKLKKYRNSN